MRGFFCAAVLAAVAGATGSGCAVFPHYALIYTDVQSDQRLDPKIQNVRLEEKRYEILGRTRAQVEIRNYLGFVAVGSDGIVDLYQQALAAVPGANLLIDVHVDYHIQRILGFFLRKTTILEATAVKVESGAAGSGGGEKAGAERDEDDADEADGPA